MASQQLNYEGSSIQAWDIAHGIRREIRNGCEYVICDDLQRMEAICKAEREADFKRKIVEQQYESAFGGAEK